MGRAIRIVLLVLLLLILAIVVWMRVTPEGRELAGELFQHWRQSRHGGTEQDAAEKLTAMGALVVHSLPDQSVASINCTDKTLGDEGYRLIGECYRLQVVNFNHCDVTDDRLRYLTGLSDLTSLVIIDTPAVTDAGIKHIAKLGGLVGLSLKGTEVGDAGLKQIGQLSELGTLNLSNTRITDAGLPALTGLGKLQWLVLIGTEVTDDGVANLKGLSSLRQITLNKSKVTDKGKAQLMKMYPGLTID